MTPHERADALFARLVSLGLPPQDDAVVAIQEALAQAWLAGARKALRRGPGALCIFPGCDRLQEQWNSRLCSAHADLNTENLP